MSLAEEVLPMLDLLLEAGEMVQALEDGTRAVLDQLAEAADDVVASYVPAYAALKLQCSAIPGCEETVKEVRNDLFAEVAKVVGLWGIVDAIRQAWMAMPGPIREVAGKLSADFIGKAKSVVNIATDIWSDPGKLWDDITDPEGLLKAVNFGEVDLTKGADGILTDWFEAGLEDVLGPLESLPLLGPIAAGLVDTADLVLTGFSDATSALDEAVAAIPVVGDVVDAVKDVPIVGDVVDFFV